MLDNVMAVDTRPGAGPAQRRLLIAIGVALLVALAGCAGGIMGSDAEPADQVPEDANFLAHVDMALLQDEDTERLLNGLAEEAADEEEAEDVFEEFEDETGLDLREASEVLAFGEIPADRMAGDESGGFIVYADWAEEDVVSAIEDEQDIEYEATEHQGESVLYEPVEEPEFGSATYLGVLGDGQFVIGDEASVTGALDVEYGEAESVPGPVRDAYDDAEDGYLTIAVAPPDGAIPEDAGRAGPSQIDFSAFQNVQATSVVYDTDDGAARIEVALIADNEDDAQDIEDVTDGSVSFVRGSIEDDDITDELRKIEVDRDGETVRVTYESDVDDILDLYEKLDQM